MADTLQISLSNIQNIKNVIIEGHGAFSVRKLGAGEELDLSTKMRRLMTIATELNKLNLTDIDENTPEGAATLAKHTDVISKYTEEINDIKRFELETYKKCFKDDNDGKNVDFLINGLTDAERGALFSQIFDIKPPLEMPDTLLADEKKEGKTDEKSS